MDGSTDVHRALADPTRAALFDLLRRGERPRSVSELAPELGVHPNTVRAHLRTLEDARLVRSRTVRRTRRGRPSRQWSVVPGAAEGEHADLAAALVAALDPLEEGGEIAERAGVAWGRALARREAESDESPETAPLDRLCGLLELRGFAPELSGSNLAMRRCPFRELAERHGGVVCAFHAGLITGVLEETEAAQVLVELRPWVTSDRCVARLRRRGR